MTVAEDGMQRQKPWRDGYGYVERAHPKISVQFSFGTMAMLTDHARRKNISVAEQIRRYVDAGMEATRK